MPAHRAAGRADRYGVRVRETARGWTAVWLVVLALVQTAALLVVWRFALHTEVGQWLDTVALTGNRIGQDRIDGPVDRILNAMSVVSLLAATAVIGFIALIRGRKALAVTATLLIAGANVSTQLLKYVLTRPDFGVDPERAAAGNSLPSGHTAVAASVAVALILVLPPQVRALGAFLGAGVRRRRRGGHPLGRLAPAQRRGRGVPRGRGLGGAGRAGPAVLPAGTGAGRRGRRAPGRRGRARRRRRCWPLVASGLALSWLVDLPEVPADELARRPLLVGYAGSAAGIVGTIAVVAALVLAVGAPPGAPLQGLTAVEGADHRAAGDLLAR